MPDALNIALDAMGGDHAPDVVVEGAALSRIRHPQVQFTFFGDQAVLNPMLAKHEAWALCQPSSIQIM